jgi:hypothetical protein
MYGDADPTPGITKMSANWKEPYERKKQKRKCRVRSTPDCALMRDRFLRMSAEISDKVSGLKQQMSAMQEGCDASEGNYRAQESGLEGQQRDAQTALAESTKTLNQQEELARLKNEQVTELNEDLQKTMASCETNMQTFSNQILSVKQIRAELYKMANVSVFIQDCEVSSWTPDACSVTCGSGTQLLTRRVLSPEANGGAQCPPLQMQRTCNEQPCPINCEVAEWSAWSSCTARCGGGVKQRARVIMVEPEHGGQPCGSTTDASSCNVQSCDRDCQLAEWSDWSSCSKMCGGGLLTRKRDVHLSPTGNGKCPDAHARSRLEYLPCNEDACVPAPGNLTLQCDSKLDVVIILDMTGPLGEESWEAKKTAAHMLAQAFHGGEDGVRLALLTFSGPTTWDMFRKCTKGAGAGEAQPDLALDCHVNLVSHLTDDLEAVGEKIPALEWEQGTPITPMATMMALSELRAGRRSAQSVVLMITDSAPVSPEKMAQVADKVRSASRFMWIPVTDTAPLQRITTWSSTPVRENVIAVKDFETLVKPSTISTIIANMCPQVK